MTGDPDGVEGRREPVPLDPSTVLGPGGQVDQDALLAIYEAQDDDCPVVVSLTLVRDRRKRLDRYLVDRIPFLSRSSIQRLISEQAVMVNGIRPKASTRLRAGDTVEIVLPPPPGTLIPPEEIPLNILHEDEHLVILNKHADIIVHPARGNRRGTILNALAWHFQQQSHGELSPVGAEHARPGVVHRLDRHTTGVLLVAKTETAHWRLGRQFEQRRVDKRYLALVHGRVEPPADVLDQPIGRHATIPRRQAIRWDGTGKASTTIYRVREMYRDFTLLEVELKTGRTHQIRVHLSAIGYPIAGDDMYGGRHLSPADLLPGLKGRSSREPVLGRQALHATMIGFSHPDTGQDMVSCAPLPDDLRTVLALLRQGDVDTPAVAGTTIDLEAAMGS